MSHEKRMQALVESYYASGIGLTKFAASKGIDFYQLRYWVRKLNKEKAASPGFIEVGVPTSSTMSCLLEIDYPNGVKIKLTTGDFPYVRQLINLY